MLSRGKILVNMVKDTSNMPDDVSTEGTLPFVHDQAISGKSQKLLQG